MLNWPDNPYEPDDEVYILGVPSRIFWPMFISISLFLLFLGRAAFTDGLPY